MVVLYLVVRKPEASYEHLWKNNHLMELQTHKKVVNKIKEYQDKRIYIKLSGKGETICSGIVDRIEDEPNERFRVFFKDISTVIGIVPKEVPRTFANTFAEGLEPIKI